MLNEQSEPSLNKKQPPFVARLHFWVKEQEKKKKRKVEVCTADVTLLVLNVAILARKYFAGFYFRNICRQLSEGESNFSI